MSGRGRPTVSIGLPVHNGEQYLEEAIFSILGQSFEDLELVISDNGSNDRTAPICRAFAEHDERVRYYRSHDNRGAAWNYNRVFALSRGRFFKWAAHDDVCEPQFLARCLESFGRAPNSVVLVYPRTLFVDAHGDPLGVDGDRFETTASWPAKRAAHMVSRLSRANAVFGLIRSEALHRTRLIDRFASSDYVLLLELALLGQIREVPEVLLRRRLHAASSRAANTTPVEVAAWFGADSPPRLPERSLLLREYVRSVARLPLTPAQRAACCVTVPTAHYGRRARVLAGRYKRRVRDRIHGGRDDR